MWRDVRLDTKIPVTNDNSSQPFVLFFVRTRNPFSKVFLPVAEIVEPAKARKQYIANHSQFFPPDAILPSSWGGLADFEGVTITIVDVVLGRCVCVCVWVGGWR